MLFQCEFHFLQTNRPGSLCEIIFEGLPATVTPSGTSLTTTVPAPIVTPLPIVTFSTIQTFGPIYTLSPMCAALLFALPIVEYCIIVTLSPIVADALIVIGPLWPIRKPYPICVCLSMFILCFNRKWNKIILESKPHIPFTCESRHQNIYLNPMSCKELKAILNRPMFFLPLIR